MHTRRLIKPNDFWSDVDGSRRAPPGAPQLPSMLRGYKRRPPWKVAGVDYRVGPFQGRAVKDPSAISMTGVSVNVGTKTITITGDNVALDGYDMSAGWGISAQAASATITNCNFVSNNVDKYGGIFGNASATNMVVRYCTFDNLTEPWQPPLMGTNGAGMTVEYCYFHDATEDAIQYHVAGNLLLRYNVFDVCGTKWSSGAHGDFLQVIVGPITASIRFNTTLQDTASQSAGFAQGLMLEPNTLGLGNCDYTCNTMVNTGPSTQFFATNVTTGDGTGTIRTFYNYFTGMDLSRSGSTDAHPGDGNALTIFKDNPDLSTGIVETE